MQTNTQSTEGKDPQQTTSESSLDGAACSLLYSKNVTAFVAKWQPIEGPRRKAFWKEFRKAANAYNGNVNEAKAIIRDLLNQSQTPYCAEMHHRKNDRHEYDEHCPVVEKVMKTRRRAESFILANSVI